VTLLQDDCVSRRHLEVRWGGQSVRVIDLNSSNGTYVNGAAEPLKGGSHDLKIGDTITFGLSGKIEIRGPSTAT
jgi:pSer/pThr/pTyr-binding forkhead associated (FHA) protein